MSEERTLIDLLQEKSFWHECDQGAGKYIILFDDVHAIAQAYADAQNAVLAQQVEQEKKRADLNESIARARDVIAAGLAQQVEELKKDALKWRPMRILDLFCGAGGAAMGLHQAFPEAEIVGVDCVPQKNYPFTFVLGDAMTYPLEGFDFIWASPPCQKYATAAISHRKAGRKYQDLIAGTRERLVASGIPWVMENVTKAPIRRDVVLCGSHFGLKVVRHRAFEFWDARKLLMPPCNHARDVITVCGHGSPSGVMKQRVARGFHPNPTIAEKREAMGIDWCNRGELSQAIPPAYSRYIGEQFKLSQAEAKIHVVAKETP